MTSEAVKAAMASESGKAFLAKIVTFARAAASAAKVSPTSATLTVDGHGVSALPGGMCDRFARQCHEYALGISDHQWEFAGANAAATEARLKSAGRALAGCVPGAVGLWDDGAVGHIVIYLGANMVAENTSSHRGDPSRPGTKLTSLADVIHAHGGDGGRWYFGGKV